ncbi:hypothetical protein [Streptomyces avermitilis]|uniref:hypothetical protein n=1 Tax=Streptomyces avermitilis TaxID=33903 RepID=UPI0033BC84F1
MRRGKAFSAGMEVALRSIAAMSGDEAKELLEDSLDHWVGSGASLAALGPVDGLIDAQPSQPPGDPMARDVGDHLVRDAVRPPGPVRVRRDAQFLRTMGSGSDSR